jgi:hypothetical protein
MASAICASRVECADLALAVAFAAVQNAAALSDRCRMRSGTHRNTSASGSRDLLHGGARG